ncbi:major facilitator superfamily domain-containing protein [Zychaea mexicana]|uniref:major facilitator superfamily domain-containing protein n=1 Tax=Zychaea mexicana TaxID=64656 RepID=UPI0022FF21FE|nr:major facilitator superfamily domain-containing protein [Zychaea mexicana]KAI9488784.1 major facilitator superfamily domain-containing protein [Zychaea mexicana]
MAYHSRLKHVLISRLSIRPPVDEDPRLLSSRVKAIVLVILAMCAASSGFSSTIYFPGIPDITVDLDAPSIATTLTAALFILFMGLAPVFWAAISDYYRIRRFLFIVSMAIFGLASLGAALVNNIWGLVVLRCVQALGASCGQSVGAGVIADCYPIEQRGAAFGKYFFGVFFGPLIGPILGGFLIMSDLNWRATFWFCFAFAFMVILMIIFIYPETYRENDKWDVALPTTVKENEKQQEQSVEEDEGGGDQDSASTQISSPATPSTNSKTSGTIAAIPHNDAVAKKKKPLNPIRPFLYLRHPHVLLASLVMGVSFGAMFCVETIIPDLFENNYGFVPWQTGLSYLGAGVGNLCGAFVNTFLSDRLLMHARAKRGGRAMVEDRIAINLWPSGLILMPFGLLLFGWGIGTGMSYWTGIIGFGIQNFGMNQMMTALSAYLVDSAPGIGASFTAAANLVRMLFACVLTLCANPMVKAIGPGWTCVFLAALTYVSMGCLILLKIYGARLRHYSGYEQKDERE